jgi:hypothetical protein
MVKFDGRLSRKIVAQPSVERLEIVSVWRIACSFMARDRFVED